MIKNIKLKHQMYILILVMLFMIILLQFYNYIRYSMAIYNRAETTAGQMMEQLAKNVKTMMESVESSANGLSVNQSVQRLMTSQERAKNIGLYENVNQIVSAVKFSNHNIYGVYWISDEHRRISDATRSDHGIVNKLEDVYDFTSDEFRSPVFSSVMKGTNDLFYYFSYLFPVYSLYDRPFAKIGSGIIILDTRELDKLVKISNITENSLFIVLDQDNNIVVNNQNLTPGALYQDVFWGENIQNIVKKEVNYNGMRSIAQCQQVEGTGWKIVSIIPIEELSDELTRIIGEGLLMGLLCICLLIFLGHILIRNITRPVDVIVNFLTQMKPYSRNSRIETPLQNEFGLIAFGINEMLGSMEAMTKKTVENQTLLYESKLAEQDAQLLALQSQINPHFLYNTLNCLSNIGLAYEVPEVADIAVAMSNVYRYSIKGEKMVCLEDEVRCVKEYMKIMNIRFAGKFETEYKIDKELMSINTLRMTLQPIVENALYYGLEQKKGKGKLVIDGRISEENQLILTAYDNGKGMNKKQLESLRESIMIYEKVGLYHGEKTGIGLSNINKRIKLQFGSRYGLFVDSEENVGTTVSIILPVIFERGAKPTETQMLQDEQNFSD